MQVTRMLINIVFLLAASPSIVLDAGAEVSGCDGKTCRLTGRLEVLRGGFGAGAIRTETECYDLALPREIIDSAEAWDGKRVDIVGELVSRPNGSDIAWYDIKDRRVEAGGCGVNIIYVNKITRSGLKEPQ